MRYEILTAEWKDKIFAKVFEVGEDGRVGDEAVYETGFFSTEAEAEEDANSWISMQQWSRNPARVLREMGAEVPDSLVAYYDEPITGAYEE